MLTKTEQERHNSLCLALHRHAAIYELLTLLQKECITDLTAANADVEALKVANIEHSLLTRLEQRIRRNGETRK